jgi:ABC-type sulfate transport system substrate-binding protein
MTEENNNHSREREEIFSKSVRAGRRTYFFDVKATKSNDYYLTITESKKRLGDDGNPFYEKHKIFLYREDFDKFLEGFNEAVGHVNTLKVDNPSNSGNSTYSDVDFDQLGKGNQ